MTATGSSRRAARNLAVAESKQAVTAEDVDDQVLAAVVRLGTRIIYVLYSILVIAILVSAGGAAFVTQTNSDIAAVREDVGELTDIFRQDFAVRLRNVERSIDAGILPRSEREVAELRKRVSKLEEGKKGAPQ